MANLKAIRDRIQSVKNTKKITEAMRLVAAARVRRAQEQVIATRPFADRLAQVLYGLQVRLKFEDVDLPLLKKREVKSVGLLVVSGDRGLCGGYNSNVIRRAENRAKELKAEGLDVTFVIVGRKANQYFQRRGYKIDATYSGLEQIPTATEATNIADELLSLFLSEKVDRIELVYTRFVSLVSSRPVVQTLLPLDTQGLETPDDEIFRLTTRGGKFEVEREKVTSTVAPLPRDMIFEQDPVQILDSLLPLYLSNQLLRALQESAASELAARMTAMSNASDNAGQLISSLTLSYNKARQAAITQELLEVVGGAEALG
ncbi:F0F1 ATP synthase subunit gamma [Cylindrospermopsis raciborskii]|jgi:F-type H+-transporting ATPase subunit gamma|uniref:F0F1 ATP synthase subunit gamma n=1 Tax=Cylindrospermopsis raciborskii TaxID=77022 RepID=UPI000B5DF195|nr:F0F1 ATP synthase subunit gamma [Cylindrospermopsis raciborskii]MBU6345551.1 F0F1 ATP synthase subunit gamma [Cyanobacteria bacterium REEB494]BAZ91587.1 ATP synthase F1 subuint gamma [Raphidiopsis curvata NIES-932]TPX28772.1 F0F1 ATP synthase subunit gamma [Cylindrospermopsis raciborskii GIHE 2018]UJL33341.1 F0F1 ATP synthase subunit gamma [Cylindrospermopsis raciborskii Cr2010]UJS03413.1 F0F1 ATP synthase subunit gamma [Cylindrospermopsis raciborskii KLL07]